LSVSANEGSTVQKKEKGKELWTNKEVPSQLSDRRTKHGLEERMKKTPEKNTF
jgi:hypothetical protein